MDTIYTFRNTEELWTLFSDRLRAFIISKVKDESVANDILQEVFLRIHQNIDKLEDQSKVQSWIFQIARNAVTDYFRKASKSSQSNETFDQEEESKDYSIFDEAVRDMVSMMNRMPPEYCEALCLTELEGLSQKEYAEKIGISYSGAKSRVQRARTILKDMLMDCCHYQFDKYGTVLSIHPKCCCCCHPTKRKRKNTAK